MDKKQAWELVVQSLHDYVNIKPLVLQYAINALKPEEKKELQKEGE